MNLKERMGKQLKKIQNEEKEIVDYKELDIELAYIMTQIDLFKTLDNLKIDYIEEVNSGFVRGFCPDHELYVNRTPSHPKWTINVDSGKTFCFTESRTSSLLDIVKNLNNYDTYRECKEFLLEGKTLPNKIAMKRIVKQTLKPVKKYDPKQNKTLNSLRPLINQGKINQNCLDFFLKDGINEVTLKKFNIISIDKGKYKERALIPFYDNEDNELRGFVAVDYLKKKKWVKNKVESYLKNNQLNTLTEYKELYKKYIYVYKKVLFCKHSKTIDHLYGFSQLDEKVEEVVLVEGERDTLKLQQEGFNALGTHGTHLTKAQKNILLKKGVKRVILAYDPDAAGQEAAKKIEKFIKDDFYEVTNLKLPNGRDPKTFGREEFLEVIKSQKPKIDSYWSNKIN